MSTNKLALYLALVVCGLGLYVLTKPGPATVSKPPPKRKTRLESRPDPDEYAGVPFPKPNPAFRDVFLPVNGTNTQPGAKDLATQQVPPSAAGGEADWIYTGMAEIDGERMALLENPSKKVSGFAKEGQTWKSSRIVRISSDRVVFADSDGVEQTVMRYSPNTATPASNSAPAPSPPTSPVMLMPGMHGPIPGMQLPPGVTMGGPIAAQATP